MIAPRGLEACRPCEVDDLLAQGFELRFVVDARMATDAVSTYEELGFEVRALALDSDQVAQECEGCALRLGECRAIYTRRRA